MRRLTYCTRKLYTGGTLITQIKYNTLGTQYSRKEGKSRLESGKGRQETVSGERTQETISWKGRQDEQARNVRMKGMGERGGF
jgi:hypothetical protein